MSVHVMVDIETLGKGDNAVLLSLGAVKFDPMSSDVLDQFYVAISPESCTAYGLKLDASTVMWWMDDQRSGARSRMMGEDRLDIATALDGFAMWFGNESLPVWGNGATFDNVILRNAYTAVGLDTPWKYWDDRCYRTFKNLAPGVKLERIGTFHNALDDAISQARHMQSIVAHLGLAL